MLVAIYRQFGFKKINANFDKFPATFQDFLFNTNIRSNLFDFQGQSSIYTFTAASVLYDCELCK